MAIFSIERPRLGRSMPASAPARRRQCRVLGSQFRPSACASESRSQSFREQVAGPPAYSPGPASAGCAVGGQQSKRGLHSSCCGMLAMRPPGGPCRPALALRRASASNRATASAAAAHIAARVALAASRRPPRRDIRRRSTGRAQPEPTAAYTTRPGAQAPRAARSAERRRWSLAAAGSSSARALVCA